MTSEISSTATKSPKRFVTLRNSIKGLEEGSFHGAKLRRTGPSAFPTMSAPPPRLTSAAGRYRRPKACHNPLNLRIIRRRCKQLREGLGRRIDGRIVEDVRVDELLRRLVA